MNGVTKLAFENITLEVDIFILCKQPNNDSYVQDVNWINVIFENDSLRTLCTSDVLELRLVRDSDLIEIMDKLSC